MTAPSLAAITIDLDTTRFYRDIHGLPARPSEGADVAYAVGVSRFLDLCEAHGIRATLFVIGEDVAHPAHHALLTQAHMAGHELANHTYHHRYDLRAHTRDEIRRDIAAGEEAIAEVTGTAPVGFRTPGYNLDAHIFDEITQRGYLYDSSILPCPPYYLAKGAVMTWLSLRGKPSRSMMTPATNNLSPLTPYRPRPDRIWRPDTRRTAPLEIPMCVLPGVRVPVIGTSLHMLRTAGFRAALPVLWRTHRELLQLEFHAIDFVDADNPGVDDLVRVQPDVAIPWETKRRRYGTIFEMISDRWTFVTLERAVRSMLA